MCRLKLCETVSVPCIKVLYKETIFLRGISSHYHTCCFFWLPVQFIHRVCLSIIVCLLNYNENKHHLPCGVLGTLLKNSGATFLSRNDLDFLNTDEACFEEFCVGTIFHITLQKCARWDGHACDSITGHKHHWSSLWLRSNVDFWKKT